MWDNARFLAVTLVVVGHSIQRLTGASDNAYVVYLLIYSFHMPAFAVISGYFSKPGPPNASQMKRVLTDILLPYFIMEAIWTVVQFLVDGEPGFQPDKSELDPVVPPRAGDLQARAAVPGARQIPAAGGRGCVHRRRLLQQRRQHVFAVTGHRHPSVLRARVAAEGMGTHRSVERGDRPHQPVDPRWRRARLRSVARGDHRECEPVQGDPAAPLVLLRRFVLRDVGGRLVGGRRPARAGLHSRRFSSGRSSC